MKRCGGCRLEKPLSEFHKNRSAKDGLQGYCKPCNAAKNREQVERYRQVGEGRTPERKTCPDCKVEKPSGDFSRKSGRPDGLHTYCRPCVKRHKQWARYGISPEEYTFILEHQGGVCAICGATTRDDPRGRLHVDHCHETGTVRGLLCFNCNGGLGQFRDDPARLRAAIEYLARA